MTAALPALAIDAAAGLLLGARQVLSPYCDARPAPALPELILVHGISLPAGEFGGPWIDRLFTGNLPAAAHPDFRERAALRVSAHVLIRRDGELTQYVPFTERAWHAGVSAYRGRSGCNDFSVGIELEGTDETPYTEHQYAQLVQLIPNNARRLACRLRLRLRVDDEDTDVGWSVIVGADRRCQLFLADRAIET